MTEKYDSLWYLEETDKGNLPESEDAFEKNTRSGNYETGYLG
jgi:hypothetical protein